MIQRTVVSVIAFFALMLSSAVNSYSSNPGEWAAASVLSVARYHFTGGVVNGKIYVFGGRGSRSLKSTETYNPATDKWSSGISNQNAAEELTGIVVNEKLYVLGAKGGGDPYAPSNFVEEYDPANDTWTSKASKPTPVSGAPAVEYGGEIFIFGGMSGYEPGSGSAIYTDAVEAYDPSTDTWRFVGNMPYLRSDMAAAVSGTMAYLIGGIDLNGDNAAADVIAYNFETDEWSVSGLGALSVPRGFAYSSAAPARNGRIYLIGGWTADKWSGITGSDMLPTDDVQIYDIATQTFHAGAPLPQATDEHLTVLLNNSLYVIGGITGRTATGSGIKTGSVWRLELPCTDNDGDGFNIDGESCGPIDCNDNDPLSNPGAYDSNCNGIDENCSGIADEGYVATATACGAGACAATGQIVCQGSMEVDTCTPGTPAETNELSCNDMMDNDCDGGTDRVDEDCASAVPDLVVTYLSNPPSSRKRGAYFTIRDTVQNQGGASAARSVTRYYLSKNSIKDKNDILMKGSRTVSALNVDTSSAAAKVNKLTIPSKIRPGKYYILACADDKNAVIEIDETNNCTASKKTVTVKK